jgi:hypothetical protein
MRGRDKMITKLDHSKRVISQFKMRKQIGVVFDKDFSSLVVLGVSFFISFFVSFGFSTILFFSTVDSFLAILVFGTTFLKYSGDEVFEMSRVIRIKEKGIVELVSIKEDILHLSVNGDKFIYILMSKNSANP